MGELTDAACTVYHSVRKLNSAKQHQYGRMPEAVQKGSLQMRVGKDLYINYDCTITYKDGKHRNLSLASVKVTKEEYRAVVAGAAEGKSLEETEGIVDVLSRMKENAAYIDKWTNLNGSYRKAPLKTPRAIEKMEVSLTDEEVRKIRRMPDPLATFDRPEEHMTIYRNDGSSVTIDYEFGTVRISDTRKKGSFSNG